MRLRTFLLSLCVAALLDATQATFAHSASAFPWCADDRGRSDFCYYGDGRQCWVTMSGLGVCVPSPQERAPSRHRRVLTERRH